MLNFRYTWENTGIVSVIVGPIVTPNLRLDDSLSKYDITLILCLRPNGNPFNRHWRRLNETAVRCVNRLICANKYIPIVVAFNIRTIVDIVIYLDSIDISSNKNWWIRIKFKGISVTKNANNKLRKNLKTLL